MILAFYVIGMVLNPLNPYKNRNITIAIEPVFAEIIKIMPKTAGCISDSCGTFIKCFMIGIASYSAVITMLTIIEFGLYYYKERQIRQQLVQSKSREMNAMLFRALTIQLAMIVCLFFCPIGMIELISILHLNYASFYAQLALFPILLYPILDVVILMYFVKPYRTYVKELYKTVLNLVKRSGIHTSNVANLSN
jgi:hypothetical protein